MELGFVLADAAKQAIRGKTIVGDLVIAGTDCEKLKIRQSQSYVLRRIYWQGVDDTGSVRQVDAEARERHPLVQQALPGRGQDGAARHLRSAHANCHIHTGVHDYTSPRAVRVTVVVLVRGGGRAIDWGLLPYS